MKTTLQTATIASLALSSFLFPPSASSQGPLTPPGAPAPTMKTLQQVEPRTDLQATPAPAGVDTTNASYHFIINQPGSYYLSANLGVTKANGIQMNVEGVTLDLNGFEISRASGSGGNGIEIPDGRHRASIHNGSIRGFSYGIQSITGSGEVRGCAFRDLAVSACTSGGIYAGQGAVLESCRAHDNSGTYGIHVDRGSSLSNCTACRNTVTYGIDALQGCSMTNCTATSNTAQYGINAVASSVTNCTAYNNFNVAPPAVGINLNGAATLTHCTAAGNNGDGIRTYGHSNVLNNTATLNGGAGIHATSERNRIDGNHAASNSGDGFLVDDSTFARHNVVIRNTSFFNSGFQLRIPGIPGIGNPGDNAVGPVTTDAGTTSPWANLYGQ